MNSKTSFIVFFSLLLTLVLLFFGLKRNQSVSIDDTLAKVQSTHKIKACTVIDPPGVIKDAKTGNLSGHQIDALNLIAKKMDATVEWSESTFGNIAAELQSKRCDIAVTDLFANIPRAQAVAFTRPPLFYIGESAIVKKDGPYAGVKDIYDFDKPNITVAVATGESGDIFVKEHFSQAKVNRIDVESSDLTRFIVEVSAGRADVAITDSNTVRLYAAQHPETVDLFKDNPFALNPVGWAVRQDDTKWLEFINTSLQFLDTQGTLTQLEKQYNAHWLHEVKQFQTQ
ncbi:MAG TPA: transporter substrate-binding domain-containing protein [Candidatus Limnocylindria bacterium]|nr:transporter substrate-binding domain-containing protein [Candidatus Limnocylindria bacterium]